MIKINNKEVSLRFGMLSVEIFLGKISDDDVQLSLLSSYGVASMIYAGMVNFYKVEGKPNPLTFKEIYDYVEDSLMKGENVEDIQKVVVEFESSQPLKRKTETIEKAVEEKKSLISNSNE
jgi:hypothetical protein